MTTPASRNRIGVLAGAFNPVTEQGLFADIARELREQYPDAELCFICGRDAAERVIHWDYGDPGAIERILENFRLLVASRRGELEAPPHLRHRVEPLPLTGDFDDVSSTEVRKRIAAGLAWEHLVPEPIIEMVRRIYRTS